MEETAALHRIARDALVGALVVVGLLVLLWFAVFHVVAVDRVDRDVFWGFRDLSYRRHVVAAATHIADLCDVRPYVLLAAVPICVALRRRRYVLAVAIVLILSGANLTTHILKPLVAEPRPAGLPPSVLPGPTWPSGHATASMSLALSWILAAPGRLRPWAAAVGAAFSVAVVYSFLILGWHYPSDALGGFLIAALWTLLGIAGICVVDARLRRRRAGRQNELSLATALTPPAAALCAALLVIAMLVWVRPGVVLSYAEAHKSFVIGAAVLGALGLLIATGVMMTLRKVAAPLAPVFSGSDPDPTAARRLDLPPG